MLAIWTVLNVNKTNWTTQTTALPTVDYGTVWRRPERWFEDVQRRGEENKRSIPHSNVECPFVYHSSQFS